MKKLILVALILQLVIIIISAIPANKKSKHNYEFGDIIVFPRHCEGDRKRPKYNHYAVYVGPQSEVNVGQGNNDIVHRTRLGKPSCQFAQLETVKDEFKEEVYNYLDGIENAKGGKYTPGTTEEIKTRITEMLRNCPDYNLICNNCEHFATKVRYGVSVLMQVGAAAESFVSFTPAAKARLRKIKETIEEVKCVQSSQASG